MSATIRPHWGAKQVLAYGLIAAVSLFVMVRYLQAVHASAVQQYAGACASLQPEVITDRAAPAFDLKDVAGKRTRLADLRGKLVLVNFWATWCPPCVEELPSIIKLNQLVSGSDLGRDVAVITISADEEPKKVTALMKKFGAPGKALPVLIDSQKKVPTAFGTTKFPETYLIDRQGKLRYRFINKRRWDSDEALQCLRNAAAK